MFIFVLKYILRQVLSLLIIYNLLHPLISYLIFASNLQMYDPVLD